VYILESDPNKSKLNHEEIKFVERLPQSVHNFLPYRLLSKSVKLSLIKELSFSFVFMVPVLVTFGLPIKGST
jgi:hypothetical protein